MEHRNVAIRDVQVLSRWDLSCDIVWDQLNGCILFLAWSSFAHGLLILALLVVTMPLTFWPALGLVGWVLRIFALTLLDVAYALSGLQLAKVRFAHGIEGRAKKTWEGWLLVHGGLDYMRSFVSGRAGPTFLALVHWPLDSSMLGELLGALGPWSSACRAYVSWPRPLFLSALRFLDDEAAVCNGLRGFDEAKHAVIRSPRSIRFQLEACTCSTAVGMSSCSHVDVRHRTPVGAAACTGSCNKALWHRSRLKSSHELNLE